MKILTLLKIGLISLLYVLNYSNVYSQAPQWIWAKSAGGTSNDETNTVKVDASGNIYLAGYFGSPTLTFGSTTLTNPGLFFVKYDPNGNVLWAKDAGGGWAYSVAVDALGSIYLVGSFINSPLTLGSTTLTNSGSMDIFIAKYDANGNVLWAKSAGGVNYDNGLSVAVDASGNAYVAGYFKSPTITFGTITLTNVDNTGGSDDIFLAKYDINGNVLLAKSTGGTGDDLACSVTTDASGNICLVGSFTSPTLTFGSNTLTNSGLYDIFLAKYNSIGNVLWAKVEGGIDHDLAFSVTVDSSGNTYIAGFSSSSTITFDSITLTNNINNLFNIYLAKYGINGNILWAKNPDCGLDSPSLSSCSVSTDDYGNAYVAGKFYYPTCSFGSTTLTNASYYNYDLVLAKCADILTVDVGIDQTIICGDTAQLNVTSDYKGSGIVYYNWSPSTGINNNSISNPIATVKSNTKYFVTVSTSDGWSAIDSVTVYINPLIINVSNNTSTTCGTAVILNTTNNYTGSGTLIHNWQPTIGLSATSVSSPTANPGSTTTYTVTLSTPNGCVASDQATVTLDPMPVEEICYVEFDTTTSKNSINWSTNLPVNIGTVHIYNEIATNVWSLIGTATASQSNFIDINSNPLNQSYSYKISLVDTCGIETDYSAFHTTITLMAAYDQGTNTYGFTWSAYQGLTVATYYLYGITASGTETLIGSVPGNQYFYNYTNPSLTFVKYFIGFNTPVCTSKINHMVKSNFIHSTILSITETICINNLVSFYPNPVNDNLQIQTALKIKSIDILDITGRLLLTTTSKTIDCRSFAKGFYFITLTTEKGKAVKKFIKE